MVKFIFKNKQLFCLLLKKAVRKHVDEMGLDHPLDGITNPKYKLLHFLTTNFFLQREEGTSF